MTTNEILGLNKKIIFGRGPLNKQYEKLFSKIF